MVIDFSKITFERVAIALLVCAVAFMAYRSTASDESAGDLSDVTSAAREGVIEFAGRYGAMRDAMADALRSGDIRSAEEYVEWFEAHRDEARMEAFERFSELENEHCYDQDGVFQPDKAMLFNHAAAEGFREID